LREEVGFAVVGNSLELSKIAELSCAMIVIVSDKKWIVDAYIKFTVQEWLELVSIRASTQILSLLVPWVHRNSIVLSTSVERLEPVGEGVVVDKTHH
jgi:hypothetical protein